MYLSRELVEFSLAGLLVTLVSFHFIKLLNNRRSITLIDISVLITGISFGLAPFILISSGGYFPKAEIMDVASSYFGIVLFIAGLLIIKKFFLEPSQKEINLQALLKKVNSINTKQAFFFYALYFIIRGIYALNYGIFMSGSATADRIISLPYYLFVARSLLDIIIFGILLWSITKTLYNRKLELIPFLIILIESLLIFFRGRRQMLFLLFLFLYIYLLLGYRIRLKVLIPSIIVLIFLLNILFPVFISFRETTAMYSQSGDIIKDYKTSYYLLSRTGIDADNYESNIATRVYINNWNTNILSKSSLTEGLNGQAMLMSIFWVIPRPMLPFKSSLKDPELLINYHFGLSLKDSPSNWPAYGFADFGLIGALFYGIILGIILFLFQKFAVSNLKKYPFFSFIIIGSFAFLAFFIEESPVAIFSVIRDSFFLFIIFYIMRIFRNKKAELKINLDKG